MLRTIHAHTGANLNTYIFDGRNRNLNTCTFDGRNRNINTVTVRVAYTDSSASNAGNYTITCTSSWPVGECAASDDSGA